MPVSASGDSDARSSTAMRSSSAKSMSSSGDRGDAEGFSASSLARDERVLTEHGADLRSGSP
jgi:hypothetical protein